MVWIHGGGFAMGDGNSWIYGPDYLVAEGVVLVTLNYRLGPLGKRNSARSDSESYFDLLQNKSQTSCEVRFDQNREKEVGFKVLTAVSTKIAVFWVVAQCSRSRLSHRPDDGGSKDL
jgi:hypothetical protein